MFLNMIVLVQAYLLHEEGKLKGEEEEDKDDSLLLAEEKIEKGKKNIEKQK